MSAFDLLVAIRRQRYAALLGLALTACIALFLYLKPGVYSSQVNVLFVAPAGGSAQVFGVRPSDSLVSVAGLIQRRVTGGGPAEATTTSDVAIVGTGVDHGSLVVLPNSGGQWNYNFSRPLLSVHAAGSSPREVRARQRALIDRIRFELLALQAADRTSPAAMITTTLSPQRPPVVYSDGHRVVASGGAVALGLSMTLVLVAFIDHWSAFRRAPSWRFRPWQRGNATAA